MSDENTAPTTEETQQEGWTFDQVWEDFLSQLTQARADVKEKEEELEKNSSLMTRIDLTEVNDARNKVNRLEGAIEALDIVRTQVIGVESLIKREESK
jgi:hypothetical protein|tara:strand:- start:1432 stop:1725 length:294 start_codon:yes stop_codon:yes gene_type:complete